MNTKFIPEKVTIDAPLPFEIARDVITGLFSISNYMLFLPPFLSILCFIEVYYMLISMSVPLFASPLPIFANFSRLILKAQYTIPGFAGREHG